MMISNDLVLYQLPGCDRFSVWCVIVVCGCVCVCACVCVCVWVCVAVRVHGSIGTVLVQILPSFACLPGEREATVVFRTFGMA